MTQIVEARPLTARFGAELVGVDVRDPSEATRDLLWRAVLEHGVVFLRGQDLSDDEQLALARRFGTLSVYPVLRIAGEERPLEFLEDTADDPPKADRWHTDLTWLAAPPKLAFLSMRVAPDAGGDTVWADTAAAYDALSPAMRAMLRKLRVRHHVGEDHFDLFESRFGPDVGARCRAEYSEGVEHPLVRRNDDTARDALFLAGYWMDQVVGMRRDESDDLLAFLMQHATRPERCARWHWAVDDLAIWDERRTMHVALNDHYPRHRLVRRCTIDGDVPLAAPA